MHRTCNLMEPKRYPPVVAQDLVGTYDAHACAGGGFVWDAVLEYRVWCHPERGAPDEFNGDDYYYAFGSYDEALEFADRTTGAEKPIALILQLEHINEPEPGIYEHVTTKRITEWPVEFLMRPQRTPNTIPDFFAADTPANRLEIIRGPAES